MNLDIYGRYTLSMLESDTVRMHDKADSKFHMDSTVTHGLRAGLRFTGDVSDTVKWKAGIAYDRTLGGDADGRINNVRLDTPTLSGETGVGELGLQVKPSAKSPWTLGLSAKGYAGDRRGFAGNVKAVYAF